MHNLDYSLIWKTGLKRKSATMRRQNFMSLCGQCSMLKPSPLAAHNFFISVSRTSEESILRVEACSCTDRTSNCDWEGDINKEAGHTIYSFHFK